MLAQNKRGYCKLWTKIENIIQVSSPCGLDDEHLDTQQMNMQLLSLHSYSLRFAMAACRAADAKPDLPRLDYISCKKKKKKHCNRCSQWAVHK